MTLHVFQTAASGATVVSGGPAWTDVVAAIGAGVAGLAALSALVIAFFAARYAKRQVDTAVGQLAAARGQLDEARDLRREQTRPYVVVYTEPRATSITQLEVVIANFGTTGAYDIVVTSTPPLVRTTSDSDSTPMPVALPEVMPFLAPGQRWATFWDSTLARRDSGLPDRFQVSATYRDSSGVQHTEATVLDWKTYRPMMYSEVYGVHHAAKALREIDKTLGKWSKRDEVLRVATYDGAVRDKHLAANRRAHQRMMDRIDRQMFRSHHETNESGEGAS